MSYRFLVLLHILLLVYWLGADLGVLLLARQARRRDLSLPERGFALRMALTIDFLPRIAFATMFPVGLALTDLGGFAAIPAWAHAASWGAACGWIALIVALARSGTGDRAVSLNRAHLAVQGAALLVLGVVGLQSVMGSGPFPSGWLAWKVVLFAAIFGLGIGIDYAFRPVGPAFASIASEGSNERNEAAVTRGIDGAIRYVLILYALLIASALLGVVKPF
ncbi:MAG: hypothetical protein NZM12_00445 [Steroidobacteraceae bacterium]|nr:hypothetical protein [Steroidobacteraceae bacterium]MDW8259739.1 hypothetical protein [Gammaproteobacteria bacterium]